jgi:hypothetical protein
LQIKQNRSEEMSDSVHNLKDRQQASHVSSDIGGNFALDENVIADKSSIPSSSREDFL